jgi:restriction endonuclease Mrr
MSFWVWIKILWPIWVLFGIAILVAAIPRLLSLIIFSIVKFIKRIFSGGKESGFADINSRNYSEITALENRLRNTNNLQNQNISSIQSSEDLSHTSLHSDKELMWQMKGMEPAEFEEFIAELFVKLGYKAQTTGAPHDGGVDVVLEKDGVQSFVQCKKYNKNEVNAHAVRDFYGAIADYLKNGGRGYFITTKKFTHDAEKFAENKPIELVDGVKIINYIRLAEQAVSDNK